MVRINLTIVFLIISLFAMSQGGVRSTRSGLIGYWKFEETSGTIVYDELGNNNGTINGATINQTGIIGKCYDYNGTSDYVGSISMNDIPFPLTISCWINTTFFRTNAYHGIVTKGGIFDDNTNFDFGVRERVTAPYGSRVYCYWRNSGTLYGTEITVIDLNNGNWHHIAAVIKSNNDLELYADGVLVATDGSNAAFSSTSHDLQFAKWSGTQSASDYYPDKVDEVVIYNRDLSDIEVSQLYNSNNGLLYVYENFKNNKIDEKKYLAYVADWFSTIQ